MKGGDTLGRNPTPVVHVRCSRPQLVIAGFLTHQTMPFRSGKKILKSSPDHSYNIYIYIIRYMRSSFHLPTISNDHKI